MESFFNMSNAASFNLGHLVQVKSQAGSCGAVISVNESGPEVQYGVLIDGKSRTFFASQLELIEDSSHSPRLLKADDCRALMTARYINHPGTSTLYSLNAARIDHVPYQFRPVIRFIRADRPRLLIADGVGVGKTIEAWLILKELQARQEVNSVLIICPRPLITEKKWQTEMKRFDQNFEHFDGRLLRHCISECDLEGEWPENHRFGILPYSLLNEQILLGSEDKRSSQPHLLGLDPAPKFDLVIVDEAHHVSNEETYRHRAVRYFCDNAEAAVFLTATPLQLGNNDLFSLLNLLRPDVVIDRGAFEHMSAPNPMLNAAVSFVRNGQANWQTDALAKLEEAEQTAWGQTMFSGHPTIVDVKSKLNTPKLDDVERVRLINRIEELHTFSQIINRTRRRDIGAFTIRRSETVSIEFTEPQQKLHDALLSVQADIFTALHGSMNVKFMMTTIRRQAASCLFGLAPFIEDILSRYVSEQELSEVDIEELRANPDELETIAEKVKSVVELARELPPEDPKLKAVVKIVLEKQDESKHKNHRVMLFSSFRHTLRYLHSGLSDAGVRVGMVHGGVADEDRTLLRRRFELERFEPEALDVLLFSEVGCEGLDYQFCDCMINYDLPWNPMRVEQRIGRIDRNGQKSEFISIYNLITPGTVDADIYERCLMRIGIFKQSLGDCEEILGRITSDIHSIAIDPKLSNEERREQLRQLADNEIRDMQEEERFEEQQTELFGIDLPNQERINEEVEKASSYWLAPDAMNNLIGNYLEEIGGAATVLGEKPLKTLRTNQDVRIRLLADSRKLRGKGGVVQRDWEKWLKGKEPHLAVTFDGQCANENRTAHLLTPVHPLVKQAAIALDSNEASISHLEVNSNEIPVGIYPFAVFQWELIGIRKDLEIVAVANDLSVDGNLLELLQSAVDVADQSSTTISENEIKQLEEKHYGIWKVALEAYRQRVKDLANFKSESLNASHRGRLAVLNERLRASTEEKIIRMREAEISRAQREYNERMDELRLSSEQADITTDRLLLGTLEVKRGIAE